MKYNKNGGGYQRRNCPLRILKEKAGKPVEKEVACYENDFCDRTEGRRRIRH